MFSELSQNVNGADQILLAFASWLIFPDVPKGTVSFFFFFLIRLHEGLCLGRCYLQVLPAGAACRCKGLAECVLRTVLNSSLGAGTVRVGWARVPKKTG